MGAVLLMFSAPLTAWAELGGFERAQHLGVLIGGGAGSYLAAVVLAGLRPRHLAPA